MAWSTKGPIRQSNRTDSVKFTAWWYRLFGSSGMAAMTGIALSMITFEHGVGPVSLLMFITLITTTTMVRIWQAASIDFYPTFCLIRSLTRTHQINWDDISQVECGEGSNFFLIPFRVPYFHLKNGTTIVADHVRSLRKNTVVDRVIDEANRRLSAQG